MQSAARAYGARAAGRGPHGHGCRRRRGAAGDPRLRGAHAGRERGDLRDLRDAQGAIEAVSSTGWQPSTASRTRSGPRCRISCEPPMSLTGNLEDLPLLDILQIVSFSKKTGHLTIRAVAGDGAIVFGTASSSARSPGTRGRWTRARPHAADGDPRPAAAHPHRAEPEQLIRLREGQFNFALSDDLPSRSRRATSSRRRSRTASTRRSCCSTWRAGWTRTAATRRRSWRRRSPSRRRSRSLEPSDESTRRPDSSSSPTRRTTRTTSGELGLEPDDEDEPGDAFIDFTRPSSAAPSPPASARPARGRAPPRPAPRRRAAGRAAGGRRGGRAPGAGGAPDEGRLPGVESDGVDGAVKKAHRWARPTSRSSWSPTSACRPRAARRSRAASRW
jgi:hypothetical protein